MEPKDYERRPRESAQAYEAARTYFELNADRSLAIVGQKLGKDTALMERWSRRHEWVLRARAWDNERDAERRRLLSEEAAKQAAIWAKRDQALRERKYSISQAMLDKANRMLEFPLAQITRRSENGQEVTIVNPARWTFAAVARLSESATELARQAIRNEGSLNEDTDVREESFEFEEFKGD